jgi:hypothetical protein
MRHSRYINTRAVKVSGSVSPLCLSASDINERNESGPFKKMY